MASDFALWDQQLSKLEPGDNKVLFDPGIMIIEHAFMVLSLGVTTEEIIHQFDCVDEAVREERRGQ